MLEVHEPAFEPDNPDPASHAAQHGVTCRNCRKTWPCPDKSSNDHSPSLIPNGATVTTYEDLDRLVSWAPGANLPVVLDRDHTPWLLYSDEDGDGYAGTIPCPDDAIPARRNLEDLPSRGPLYVLFNGAPTTIAASDDTTRGDR